MASAAVIRPPRQGRPRRAAVAQQQIRISRRSRERRSGRRRTGNAARGAIADARRHRPWQHALGPGAPAAAITRRHVGGTGQKRLCHAEEGGRDDKDDDEAAKHALALRQVPGLMQPKSRLVEPDPTSVSIATCDCAVLLMIAFRFLRMDLCAGNWVTWSQSPHMPEFGRRTGRARIACR
jgi:hypothetical protein